MFDVQFAEGCWALNVRSSMLDVRPPASSLRGLDAKLQTPNSKPPAAAPQRRADLRVLFASRMVRLFACGLLAVILVLYLKGVGLGDARIGLLLTLTFLGDA